MPAKTNADAKSRSQQGGGWMRRPVAGALCCVLAVAAAYWAETRSVTRAQNLDEAKSVLRSLPVDTIDPANDGALVHLTGEARAAQPLQDPETGVSVEAIGLVREVEMLQWAQEESDPAASPASRFAYRQVWSSKLIDSSAFQAPEGHENPKALPLAPQRFTAQQVRLGQFVLPRAMAARLDATQPVVPGTEQLASDKATIADGYVYVGRGPADAQVGDVRIRYQVVPQQTVTVLSEQTGNSFRPFRTQTGALVEVFESGAHGPDAMLARALPALAERVWSGRIAALVLMLVGSALLLGAFAGLFQHIPVVRYVLSGNLRSSIVVGIAAYLLVVGLVWLSYHWLVGTAALAVAVLIPVASAVQTWHASRPRPPKPEPAPAPVVEGAPASEMAGAAEDPEAVPLEAAETPEPPASEDETDTPDGFALPQTFEPPAPLPDPEESPTTLESPEDNPQTPSQPHPPGM